MRALRIALLGYRGNMRCGGQGIYLWHLAKTLGELGHRVEVWVGPPYPSDMPFVHAVHRVTGHEFWSKWFFGETRGFLPNPPLRTFAPFAFYELGSSWLGYLPEPALFSARVFAEIAKRRDEFDLVHDVQSLGYGLLGLKRLGLPVLSTVHHPLTVDRRASFRTDSDLREAVGTAKFYPVGMQRFVARRLDHILTSSEASRTLIRRDFRVSGERVSNVWNGFDHEVFSPANVARDPHTLLCVARAADPNKGVRDLVRALAKLPEKVRLLLIDDPGPTNPVRIWGKKAGCLDRIEIRGSLTLAELVAVYRQAALLVVPSHYEGFGLPAIEGMACATPVVATTGGALPEVLGDHASLAPPGEPSLLAAAIGRALDERAETATRASRARRFVVERYGWSAIAQRTEAIYHSLVGS